MSSDRLLICDTMIAVHYMVISVTHCRHKAWVVAQHGSHGHMQLGGI